MLPRWALLQVPEPAAAQHTHGNGNDDGLQYLCVVNVLHSMCRWVNPINNYDNILMATFTLWQISTTELWVDTMYGAIAAVGVNQQPRAGNNPLLALFFIAFIVFGGEPLDDFTSHGTRCAGHACYSRHMWVHRRCLEHVSGAEPATRGLIVARRRPFHTCRVVFLPPAGFFVLQLFVSVTIEKVSRRLGCRPA